jgi:hypothetical protein
MVIASTAEPADPAAGGIGQNVTAMAAVLPGARGRAGAPARRA